MMNKSMWYIWVAGLVIFMVAVVWLFVASFVYEDELYKTGLDIIDGAASLDVQGGNIVLENDETISSPLSFTFTVLTDVEEWTGETTE